MLLRKARLYLGLGFVKLGARIAGTQFPQGRAEDFAQDPDEENDPPGTPFRAAVIGPEGREMLREGRRQRRRTKEVPAPALLGSARDLRERAELARRGGR